TEAVVGPYELNDFFLFHFLRYGATPERILYLAWHAKFDCDYSPDQVRHWLREFLRRVFSGPETRSTLSGGPQGGCVCLCPRGDWRMPSDASAAVWLAGVEGG